MAAHRLPLGVQPVGELYPEQTVRFDPADRLVLFTDGIADVVDPSGDSFGYDRLDAVLGHAPNSAAGVVGAVLTALDDFADGSPPTDDRTLVVVRGTPPVKS
jgi:serine phosphatase RsbU (regulator of sigma subunit)